MTQKRPWYEDEAVRKKYGLDEIMKQQAIPVEKPIWYDEWMRNPLESGYQPNVFDTLYQGRPLETTHDIYGALVLLEGGNTWLARTSDFVVHLGLQALDIGGAIKKWSGQCAKKNRR